MRRFVVAILCLCIAFVSGFAGYRGHRIWKQERLVRQARTFLARSDAPNALVCLRRTLQINPKNVAACRLMADFAEMAGMPDAVGWRSRLVELEPKSLSDRLALARVAVAMGDTMTANQVLDGMDAAARDTAAYHRVAGAADWGASRVSEAEAHFLQAARLDPTNAVSRLDLATLSLHQTNEQAAAIGRVVLRGLCADRSVRREALRQLSFDALRHANLDRALEFSQQLLRETNSLFSDRLLRLDVLHATRSSAQPAFLKTLQSESTHNPARACEVARWLLRTGKPQEALDWIGSLPQGTRTSLAVQMAEADCYIAARDWSVLLANLEKQSWFDLDSLRLACRARAFKEQGMSAPAKAEWLAAMRATSNRREPLVQLLNLTSLWGWGPEQEDVLWAVVKGYPKEQWAAEALSRRLFAAGRTDSLLRLYEQAARNGPDNVAILNNLALTALLLESWNKRPHDLAHQVYARNPTNEVCVSTYAYSLLVQERPDQALTAIERLKPEQLEHPGIAAYYSIILSASGNGERAKKYLALASKASLLPEEQKLVERARKES